MERGEPTFVPEWLRSGSVTGGGGSSAHHFASSSAHADVPSMVYPARNRSFKSISDFDTPRSTILERSSSSNSRSSSSNGSSKHPYSSFGRSHRDKERDREKERSVVGDHWDYEPFGNNLSGRVEKDTLRHSRSMGSRKQGDLLPRRVATDSRNGTNGNHHNGNGVLSGSSIGSSIQKVVFDKDFPSLGTEEKQGVADIGRVPSPGLTSAVQSLTISNSALMGGEGWSALAEVPMVLGSNSMAPQPVHQSAAATTPASGAPGTMAGLNMAEALAQAPSRARTVPQLSVETQRLEELAIRKSRQLIPMTPSMPKASTLNPSSDKSKPKASVRSGEMIGANKSGQQPSSLHIASQSLRGGQVKSDAPKTSHPGKFLVLKSGRENGVSHSPKDVISPTNNISNKVANSPLSVPSVASAPLRSPNNPKLSTAERKTVAFPLNLGLTAEKRPLSLAKSRSDFFNLLKKKTSTNTSTVLPDSGSVISSSSIEKSSAVIKEVASDHGGLHAIENGVVASNGDASEEAKRFPGDGEEDALSNAVVYPDEEEVAFLRSLGWDENAVEDEGLTEEEINAFYQEYMKLRPSLKMSRSMQPKLEMLSEALATSMVGGSEVSSSSSETED